MGKTWMRGLISAVGAVGMSVVSAGTAGASPPTWQTQTTPNPSSFSYFNAVSCPSRTHCVAAGSTSTSKATGPLVETWNGSKWTVIKVTDPLTADQKGSVSLTGISCASTTSCVAVGSYTRGDGPNSTPRTFSEVLANGKWTMHRTATLSGVSGAALDAVSCPSSKACVAVGDYDTSTTTGPLSESWNGSAWKLIKSAPLATSNATFEGISCPTSGHCTAVGTTLKGSDQIALVERLNTSTWKVQGTPSVHGSAVTTLLSVSCPTSSSCIAVGESFPHSVSATLAETWNGSTWKITKTPKLVSKSGDNLDGVSCTGVKVCRAVGARDGSGENAAAVAESWNGSAWAVQSVAQPSVTSVLSAVSCTSGPHCTAAGSENPSPTKTAPLAERN